MSSQGQERPASSMFSSALNRLWRRGWFSAWPSADDGHSVLYASFHLHPDDSDSADAELRSAIESYGGETKWNLIRRQHNRFVVCPTAVADEAETIGNLGEAAKSIRDRLPNLERQAATDMRKLVEFLERKRAAGRAT